MRQTRATDSPDVLAALETLGGLLLACSLYALACGAMEHDESGYNCAEEKLVPTYEPGDYVKVEFPDDATGVGEWMWVRVQRCDNDRRLVFGVLDNAPLNDYGNKLRLGSELAISFDKIREHRKTADFEARN